MSAQTKSFDEIYKEMSTFEKAVWRALANSFQLREFGRNYVDEDGEVGFEMNSENMVDFNAASIEAKNSVIKVFDAEISRLKEELEEAKQIIKVLADIDPSTLVEPGSEDDRYTLYLSEKRQAHEIHGDDLRRARSFLNRESGE